jgi:hypothetical protein
MNKGIMSGHPRITVEHRVDGPVVVRDRSASEEVTRNVRLTALVVGVLSIALMLYIRRSALIRETYDQTLVIGLAGFGVLLAFLVVWLVLSTRRQTCFRLADYQLRVSNTPLGIGGGLSLPLEQIGHLQIEKEGLSYRVQVVSRSGLGLVRYHNGFEGIATQDEATALASTLAQQFNLKMEHGLRPHALVPHPPAEDEQIARFINPPSVPRQGTTVRIDSSNPVKAVIYRPDIGARDTAKTIGVLAGLGVFALVMALGLDYIEPGILSTSISLGLLWVVYSSALTVFNQVEFTIQDGMLQRHDRPIPSPFAGFPFTLDELEGIGVFVHWDSYDNMFYRVMAHYTFGKQVTLLDHIPEEDCHELCLALHEAFGIPLISTETDFAHGRR